MVPGSDDRLVVRDEALGFQQLVVTRAVRADIARLSGIVHEEATSVRGRVAVVLALELGVREARFDWLRYAEGISADDMFLRPHRLRLITCLKYGRRDRWGVVNCISGRHDGISRCARDGSGSWGRRIGGRVRKSQCGRRHDRQNSL